MARYTLDVNGQTRSLEVHDPQEPLLYVLRNDLHLTGAKYGCGLGQCGTCVVEVVEGMQNLSPRSDVEQVYLADRPANYRLSCRTSVNGDVTVRTRPTNAVGKGSNSLVGALKALIGK